MSPYSGKLHGADNDHITPTGDFAYEDTQKDDAYDLDEM